MGSVTTSTLANPLNYPPVSQIARQSLRGHLWAAVINNAGNGVNYYRSTYGTGTWSLAGSWTISATVREISSLHIGNDERLTIAYRTAEASQDRIWVRRCQGDQLSFTAGTPLLAASPGNGGVAGSVHTGMDVQVVKIPADSTARVVVAVGTVVGASMGVTLYGANVSASEVLTSYNAVITGKRQWLSAPLSTGRSTPSLDIEHIGNAKTANSPHLWCVFGRTRAFVVKLAWTGRAWAGPTAPVSLDSVAAQDAITGRWDGSRFLIAVPNPATGATDTVAVTERNAANSLSVRWTSPPHPTGDVRNCTLAYNSTSGDFRVYAVGTSDTVLYYTDFQRATATWTSWATVTATPIMGTTGQNFAVRRESYGSARYDVLTAHAGSPNTIVSTHQVVTYAPDVPTWLVGSTSQAPPNNGAAMDVAASLDLPWLFSDPDPVDAQTAWALSRQIGSGAVQWLRASDATWQPAEQKNAGGTSLRVLPAGWASPTDDPYTFRVRVWDTADTASLYSDGLVVVPASPVDPTITAPTPDGVTWTSDTVAVSWAVTEQSAYRVQLRDGSDVLHDSGWRAGAGTSYTVPYPLADGVTYTIVVQTRNAKGLPSGEVVTTIAVDYVEPPLPTVSASPLPALGVIRLVITNPAPGVGQPALLGNDLQRREAGQPDEVAVTVVQGLSAAGVYDDWTVRSGRNYEYRALARGANGTTGYGSWQA
ncbi:hypothetical protein [Micromonospora sp. NBC_00421]|uniref:hypothetical protein n=1 Tax=Micromonospora sp. NBC_00421 TaxID=2975976 RepID=UPI002E1A6879